MAELRPVEIIVRLEPKSYKPKDGSRVSFDMKPMAELIRCGECERQHDDRGSCPLQASGDPYYDECPPDDFYCAAAVRKT